MNRVYIVVNSEREAKRALDKLYSMGYRWGSDDNSVEYRYTSHARVYYCDSDGKLTYSGASAFQPHFHNGGRFESYLHYKEQEEGFAELKLSYQIEIPNNLEL